MEFADKKALITGASSGIGEAIARALHARGCSVLLVARRRERLEAITSELNRIRISSAEFRQVDLTDSSELNLLAENIRSSKVDILVNNAGRGSFGFFEELSLSEESALVSLNIVASMRLAHAVIPQMRARRSGSIITISSIAGFQPLPFMATYAATKAFNLVHSLALHYELKSEGVSVLTVCPGPVETEFSGVARISGSVTGIVRDSASQVAQASIRALERSVPLVFPGFWGKLMRSVLLLVPLRLATRITGSMLHSVLQKARTAQ